MDILERQTLIFLAVSFGALITGSFSLIGLIISKENKTSEFRQEWINFLRNEISDFLSNLKQYTFLHCIQDTINKEKDDKCYDENLAKYNFDFSLNRKERMFELQLNIIKSYNLIKLRINNSEVNKEHKELNDLFLKYLDDAYKEFKSKSFDTESKHQIPYSKEEKPYLNTYELVDEYIKLINTSASPILKYEWERVKAGEKWYQMAKSTSLAVFVICLIVIFYISWHKKDQSSENIQKTNQCSISCPEKYIKMMSRYK
jgi:hypothetical protein